MKKLVTVKDFKDAGLVFVDGDTYDNGFKLNNHGASLVNKFPTDDNLAFDEFAWRTNTGIKPKFKGGVEYITASGFSGAGPVGLVGFDLMALDSVVKWRPLITKEEPQESKPVYTQAMDNANELPPIGSECLMLKGASPSGFSWTKGEKLECIAHRKLKNNGDCLSPVFWNLNTDEASTLRADLYGPIDTRTDKEKLRDALVEQLASKGDMHNEFGKARDAVRWLMESNKFTITLNK